MPDVNTLSATPRLPTLPTELILTILSHHVEQTYIDAVTSSPKATSSPTSLTTNINLKTTAAVHTNIPLFAHSTLRLARTSTVFLFELSALLDHISAHVHARWLAATKALQKVRAKWYMRVWNDGATSENDSDSSEDSDSSVSMPMSFKERERRLEAEVEGCWRDVCVMAGLGAKMRASRFCVERRWDREDRMRAMKMELQG